MTGTISPKGIPSDLKPCDIYFDDNQIQTNLELNGTEHADHYGHHIMCTHFLIESKSKGKINKAIRQLENTIPPLLAKGHKLDRVIIYLDRLNKSDSRIYTQKNQNIKNMKRNILYDKNLEKFVEIQSNGKKFPVEIVYKGGKK